MGCCRGSRVNNRNVRCRSFEDDGVHQKVWPIVTKDGFVLVIDDEYGRKVDLFSYIKGKACDGIIARWLLHNEQIIMKMKAHKLIPYMKSGIELSALVNLALGEKNT